MIQQTKVSSLFKRSFREEYRHIVARSIMELEKDELDWTAIAELSIDTQILAMEAQQTFSGR